MCVVSIHIDKRWDARAEDETRMLSADEARQLHTMMCSCMLCAQESASASCESPHSVSAGKYASGERVNVSVIREWKLG